MAKVKTKKSESSNTKEIKYYTLTATCACGAEYQTGSTLKEITKVLYSKGQVGNVYVLTVTKTTTKSNN